jgi:uncharacterized protein involved in exopolysaccharide biosynthesis
MSSLVEVNPFPLAEPPADGRLNHSGERRREASLLALAWRGRWLLALMMFSGAGAGWALLQRVTPRYRCESQLYVERNLPRLLDDQVQAAYTVSYLH